MNEFSIVYNEKTGTWEHKKEPYATIEIETQEDFEKIKIAIEKQNRKKPDYEGDGYDDSGNLIYDTWICPCCGDRYEIDYEMHRFCPVCGQAIDWGDLK